MTGATFGRKGVAADAAAAPVPRATFGANQRLREETTVAETEDPYAAQRAAFLAAERARGGGDVDQGAGQERVRDPSFDRPRANAPMIVGGKSTGTAYLLWFFLGGLSVHRFYLGQPLSAIAQVCLWYVGLMFFFAGFYLAIFPLIAGAVWIVADAFLIPGMQRAANEKIRQRMASHTFD